MEHRPIEDIIANLRDKAATVEVVVNDFAALCAEVEAAKGFIDRDFAPGQEVAEFVANTHGELSELWEAHRRGTLQDQCDKATKSALTCEEEELADIAIRVLSFAARKGTPHADTRFSPNIGRALVAKAIYNAGRERQHGGKRA